MTRGRARWVSSQVLDHFIRAGGTASPALLAAAVDLVVRQEDKDEAVRFADVRALGKLLSEARRLLFTLGGPAVDTELDELLDKAEAELRVLGTAAALMADSETL